MCTDRDIRGFTLSDIVNLKQSNCVMRITQIFSEVKWLFTFVVPISLYTIDIFGSQLVHSMALCALSISSLVPSLCNVHSCHSEIASKCSFLTNFSMLLFFFARLARPRECSSVFPYEMYCHEVPGCKLDEPVQLNCTAFHSASCTGPRTFFLENVPCRYCYQVADDQISCDPQTDCLPSMATFTTRCRSHAACMGPSIFEKRAQCKRTERSLKSAILLSIFLGTFGADRFYLGYYVSASFKLITFGGLGIAYFIDIILIATGYLKPSGGALYAERV